MERITSPTSVLFSWSILNQIPMHARGRGRVLPDNVRGSMENAFGADFSGVKVHNDTHADKLYRSIQARAFTTGQDVFFRHREFALGAKVQ